MLLLCLLLLSCSRKVQAPPDVTTPEQVEEASSETPVVPVAKNIILLIGDGMGLGQITGGMYMNNNRIALEKFPVVGLHKSHSADNLVTDSAAGATAFACGVKTVNGAVGVDVTGRARTTILEEAERRGLATGLVASSTIVHATPAAFITHVNSRRNYEAIARQFLDTEIDLFIGGGKAFFTRREDGKDLIEKLRMRNYLVSDYFEQALVDVVPPPDKNFAYFTADKDPLPVSSGGDDLLPATKLSLDFLKNRSTEGFFLMIEGSQIDWGGHANDVEYVISEFLEFDKVIEICQKFAERDGNTLVIVTGDHETGGLTINLDSEMNNINASFSTGGHTAVMIPVFAYGPGSEHFGGIYDNTKIYEKLRRAYGWKR